MKPVTWNLSWTQSVDEWCKELLTEVRRALMKTRWQWVDGGMRDFTKVTRVW